MRQNQHNLEIFKGCVTSTSMVEIIRTIGIEAFNKMFANSPQLIALLDAKFGGDENEEPRRQLLEAVDGSDFSLRQWLESMRTLQSWLDTRGLEMSTEDQLGYICCAGESAGAGANLSHLSSLVADMLQAYGCDRATRARVAGADGEIVR